MPAPLKIKGSEFDKLTIKKKLEIFLREKSREAKIALKIEILIAFYDDLKVGEISKKFFCSEQTVRRIFHEWQRDGFDIFKEKPSNAGRKQRWKEEHLKHLEILALIHGFNSSELSARIKQKFNIKLSPSRIRKILNSRGIKVKVGVGER